MHNTEPGNVLYLTAEDGLGDTLRPRLEAAGADLMRVHSVRGGVESEPFTLADMDRLRALLERIRPKLVILDPITAYIGHIDMYKSNQVRPLLAKLSVLAEEFQTAVLCIRHLRKSNADKVLYRGMGSIDFAAHARSVLLAGRDTQDPDTRAIVHTKSNLAPEGPSISYTIINGRFEWLGECELTASDLLASESTTSRIEEAKQFLLEFIPHNESVAHKEIERAAKDRGIKPRTLIRAKEHLRIVSVRRNFGDKGGWFWSHPPP
ncbi:MAG: AAA family ATPase [Planctomycetota bacterium]